MGEAKQRRRQLASLDLHTPERRADIARVVRSIEFEGTIGRCVERALTGSAVLAVLGIRSRVVIGTAVYQCGPLPTDIIVFAGPDGKPVITARGLVGHAWLEAGDDLIDFSAGDWLQQKYYVDDDMAVLPRWTVAPPDFWWQSRAEAADPSLPLGAARYFGHETMHGNEAALTDPTRTAISLVRDRAHTMLDGWRRGGSVTFERVRV